TNLTLAQDREKYSHLIKDAEKLYDEKDFLNSALKYSEAFKTLGNKGSSDDRYNAACSWALSNNIDSAFVQLYRIARKGNFSAYDHIISDEDLNSLHSDKRWNEVISIIKSNKEIKEAKLDKNLIAILDTI